MHFGRFRIDRQRLLLEHAGTVVALAPKSVEVLAALAERPGEIVTKRELLDGLWPESAVEEANLSQHVYLIRKTLAACDPDARDAIVTIPKRGYRFVCPRADDEQVRPSASQAARHPWFAARRRWWIAAAAAVLIIAFAATAALHRHTVPPALSLEGSEATRIGWYYLDLRTAAGIRRSRTYFARAVGSDPRNPAGYAGLADALTMTADYGCGTLPKTTYLRWARRLAQRAAALDPRSAAAHAALGIIAQYSHDGPGALRELRQAVALDSTYAPAHHWLGTVLFDNGDFGPSLRELTLATHLNPLSTASNAWLASAAYLERRYDSVIEHARRAAELDPTRTDPLHEVGLAYAAKGDYRAALATFRRIPRGSNDAPLVPFLLAGVYAQAGHAEIARRIIDHERRLHVSNSELPFTLLALGETRAAARAALQVRPRDCREQRRFVGDPRFDAVRGNAAFSTVLARACAASG